MNKRDARKSALEQPDNVVGSLKCKSKHMEAIMAQNADILNAINDLNANISGISGRLDAVEAKAAPQPAKPWTQQLQEGIVKTQAGLDVATETINGVSACADAAHGLIFKLKTLADPTISNALQVHRSAASARANLDALVIDQNIETLKLQKAHNQQQANLTAKVPDHLLAQQLMFGSSPAPVAEPEEKMSTGTKVLVGTLVGMGGMALGFGIAYAVGGGGKESSDAGAYDNVVNLDAAAGY